MKNLNNAVERIKILECPTGDIENRVTGILEDYGVANKNDISVNRDKRYDTDGTEAYNIKLSKNTEESIIVLAQSGYDDYVAKVVNVYIK